MTPEERLTEKAALKAKKNLEKKKSFIKSRPEQRSFKLKLIILWILFD